MIIIFLCIAIYDIILELTEYCLHNKDEKKALQRYEELQRRKAIFYLSRETAMTLSIVEQIAKVQPVVNKS